MKYYLLTGIFLFSALTTRCQDLLVPYRVKDKWGYSNTEGKIIIQPIFQLAWFFEVEKVGNTTLEFAKVQLNNNKGLINRQGKLIIPCAFDWFDIVIGSFCIPFTASGGHGLYSLPDGKMLLDTIYTHIQQEAGTGGDFSLFFPTNRAGKVGIYDGNKRKWITKPDFDGIVAYSTREVFIRKGKKQFVVNLKSGIINPFTPKEETLKAAKIGEKISVNGSSNQTKEIDKNHQQISFDLSQPEVIYENGKYGYRFIESFKRRYRHPDSILVTPDIINPQYDSIDAIRGFMNRLAVKQNGKWGIVDNKNREILPIQYTEFDMSASNANEDIYAIKVGKKLALISQNRDTLVYDCDEIRFKGEYQLLRRGRLYGAYVAGKGSDYEYTFRHTLIPIRYNRIEKEVIGYRGKAYPFFYVQSQTGSGYLSPEGKEYFE
ncbi:WG repeat-containing protein [Terrimonas pollutisoli]|uniref:WG repeat-containing protein n=1 Tax=Terrimonas pollutisoli TaxID=3034147 RepID=UPI0023ED37C0|nr:WG repeat-containing protein [Terrimonas sp. H1YJ31]